MDKNYAFPRALFPSFEQLARWALLGDWPPFLKDLRLRAAAQSAVQGSLDKELHRYIDPALEWERLSSLFTQGLSEPADSVHFLPDGSWIADYAAMPFCPEELPSLFEELLKAPFSIAHLGIALFTRFRLLYIPPYISLSDPVVVVSEQNRIGSGTEVLCVIVGQGSSVSIEQRVSAEHGIFNQVLIGLCLEEASVNIISDISYGPSVVGLNHEIWNSLSGSSLKGVSSVQGGLQVWSKKEYKVGNRASVTCRCLSALQGAEQEVLITKQFHTGSDSSSSVVAKSVLCDASKSFYRGTIVLSEEAQRAEAGQQHRALIVSDKARVCALPSLEVATDNVKCSHGTAAGWFDDEQLLYLRSFGLSLEQAYDLLIEGFFCEGSLCFEDVLKEKAKQLKARSHISLSLSP